jgi:hypothetical protein
LYVYSVMIDNPLKSNKMKTYEIVFNDDQNSSSKGFKLSFEDAKNYLKNRTSSYFQDYKGGMVQIVCNETGDVAHEESI